MSEATQELAWVEVYYGHFVHRPLIEILLSGATPSTKTWPSGVKETVYHMPRMKNGRRKKDDGRKSLNGVHLSPESRRDIERLTGIKVWDAADARRACKLTNMRELEDGEELDITLKKQQAGERTEFPGWDRYGVMPAVKPFDFEARLAANRQRLGEH